MAETYKPGDAVPRTGEVKCTQHPDVTDDVTAGEQFIPADTEGASDVRGTVSRARLGKQDHPCPERGKDAATVACFAREGARTPICAGASELRGVLSRARLGKQAETGIRAAGACLPSSVKDAATVACFAREGARTPICAGASELRGVLSRARLGKQDHPCPEWGKDAATVACFAREGARTPICADQPRPGASSWLMTADSASWPGDSNGVRRLLIVFIVPPRSAVLGHSPARSAQSRPARPTVSAPQSGGAPALVPQPACPPPSPPGKGYQGVAFSGNGSVSTEASIRRHAVRASIELTYA